MVRSSLDAYWIEIDTTSKDKDAVPVLIFNTLGWPAHGCGSDGS